MAQETSLLFIQNWENEKKLSTPWIGITLDNFLTILSPSVAIVKNVYITCCLNHYSWLFHILFSFPAHSQHIQSEISLFPFDSSYFIMTLLTISWCRLHLHQCLYRLHDCCFDALLQRWKMIALWIGAWDDCGFLYRQSQLSDPSQETSPLSFL